MVGHDFSASPPPALNLTSSRWRKVACLRTHKSKSAREGPGCQGEPVLPQPGPQSPMEVGSGHRWDPPWTRTLLGIQASSSAQLKCLYRGFSCPRERINPLLADTGADSRPDVRRGNRVAEKSNCTCDSVGITAAGKVIHSSRCTKAESFPEDAWHSSFPGYWIPAFFFARHCQQSVLKSKDTTNSLEKRVNPLCLPHMGVSREERSALSHPFHSLPPLLLLL